MTSLRHNDYLDAARASLLEVGWRRTTLTDIARRAGVSRMTIYRAWPDMDALLGDLMTREWLGLADEVADGVATRAPAAERIASTAVRMAAAVRDNPVFRRILDVDPEVLLPYLLHRRGRSQEAVLATVVEEIRTGQEAGEIRAGDPVVLARTLLLAAHGLTLSVSTMAGDGVTVADLENEFTTVLVRGLQS